MRRQGADLEEKPEPRAASSAGAQEGWLHEGRGLTPAAIEKPTLAAAPGIGRVGWIADVC